MNIAALRAAIYAAVVIASLAAPWAIRRWEQVQLREQSESLREQAGRLAGLSAENARLSNRVAQSESSSLSKDQFLELLRLRGEIGLLRQTMSEIAKLKATNQQLLAGRTNVAVHSREPGPPDPQTVRAYWPKTQLAFAGYADPTSALETTLWALSQGDPVALAASVTPQAKSALTKETWFEHGPPAEEIAAATRKMSDSLSPASGFYVVGQNLMSPNQATLDVYFEGEGKTRKVALNRIGNEWKFDNLGNGAWP
jgi:hypothetical protein